MAAKTVTAQSAARAALLVVLILIGLAASGAAFAQDSPLARFVIGEGGVSGFTVVKQPAYYGPESLWNYINGGALPYLDYGVTDVVTFSGKVSPHDFEIVADIYDMADSLGAFGIYSNERFPDYDYIDIGVEGYITESALCFWKDRYYIKVFSNASDTPSVTPIETIARALDKLIPAGGGMSAYFSLFPALDRQSKTESYLAKNVLGQDYLTRAFTVTYKRGDEEFQFYIIEGENDGDAKEKFAKYRNFIAEFGSLERKRVKLGDEVFVGKEDWYGLMLFAREGRYIAGSVGLSDFDLARSHLDAVLAGLKN